MADTAAETALATIRRTRDGERADAIGALAALGTPESDVALLGLLDHRVIHVRRMALERLRERSTALARLAARAALGDSDSSVRCVAVEILEEIGTALDRQRLMNALAHDDDWVVRAHAADALAYLKGKMVRSALLLAMRDDPEPIVCRDAAHALANHEASEVIPALEQALTAEKAEQAQVGILTTLYTLGQRNRLTDLLELWRSPDDHVRYAVLNSLWDAVPEDDMPAVLVALENLLSEELSHGLRTDATEYLIELREKNANRKKEQS